MSKIIGPPQSGRVGSLVYVNSARYGPLVRQFVPPTNPRTPSQQENRSAFAAVSRRWRCLLPEQRDAWHLRASQDRTGLNGYNYYVKINVTRAHLGLSQYDLPPRPVPSLGPNPVGEVVVTNTGGQIRIKLRVPSPPGECTLVEGSGPVSAGVRCASHYRYLGLLPAAADGWSDITALCEARYGRPTVGMAIFIRTRQQVDGWMDVPKVTGAIVPGA